MKKYNYINKLALSVFSLCVCLNVFGIDIKKYEDQLRLSINFSVSGAQINENRINEICYELKEEYKKNKNVMR